MAPPIMNWDLFKSKLSNIKPINGDSEYLNKFITRCEHLIESYKIYNDAALNLHIIECIQEKLEGKAAFTVGNRVELNTWPKLKTALLQCFADRRDLNCLVQELIRAKPLKNEHLIDFGSRLQLIRSSVIQRISNDPNITAEERNCQINQYDKTALNTFIAGCDGTLKNNMHLRKPHSLEDAMAYVAEFENFERLYGSLNDKNNQQNTPNNGNRQHAHSQNSQRDNSNFYKNPNTYQNYVPNNTPVNKYPNSYSNRQYYQPNSVQNRESWPNQPIPIQSIPQNKRYFTNPQVFGPPKNVFKPNQIPQNQLPTPEPMSTTSRNFTERTRKPINNNNNNNRFFRSNPNAKPNFVSEELFLNQYGNSDYNHDNQYDEYDEIEFDENDEANRDENFQTARPSDGKT
ncbi:GATA zinc finger domain-containing protein 14-like [Diorhabda sublineata]|uniref:GATA zinc finger domain-containing protein 14-like n=1 Tax=Diorhabda sublineata TaxID=1163346 RepID=UPI0024E0CB8A|nr:GATA zinc finger domain-containing protein 14-like [Diorhabda sublineata]